MEIMIVPPPNEDQGKHDLTSFKELNKEKKVSWDQRLELIKKQFPSVTRLDWGRVFKEDPTVAGRIINDIFKVDAAAPGRPGKRPAIDEHDAQERLREMLGENYTCLPFDEAFRMVKGGRSIRQLAHRMELDRNYVYKLLLGTVKPTAKDMERAAIAINKKPQFFYEYRMAYITAMIVYRLESTKDTTITLFEKLQKMR